jgi:hypothetical protein
MMIDEKKSRVLPANKEAVFPALLSGVHKEYQPLKESATCFV